MASARWRRSNLRRADGLDERQQTSGETVQPSVPSAIHRTASTTSPNTLLVLVERDSKKMVLEMARNAAPLSP